RPHARTPPPRLVDWPSTRRFDEIERARKAVGSARHPARTRGHAQRVVEPAVCTASDHGAHQRTILPASNRRKPTRVEVAAPIKAKICAVNGLTFAVVLA